MLQIFDHKQQLDGFKLFEKIKLDYLGGSRYSINDLEDRQSGETFILKNLMKYLIHFYESFSGNFVQ